ncbi:MAG: zinc-binding dehydrogenase, partial [Firmicutes bacterium]|nr:zinc-binding dehydrogenase [Bacillota bacterium]
MKGLVVEKSGALGVRELPMPKIGDCQALTKTLACGVCNGTDMKLIHQNFKLFDTYPAAIGHEAVGEVVEVGKRVTTFKVGDHVMLPFLYGEADGVYAGWGGYAEDTAVDDLAALTANGRGPGTPGFAESAFAQTKIPRELDPVEATMIVTFREVLSAMVRFGFRANESVVIFGAGPVGLCFTRFAKLLGMRPVVTLDIVEDKLAQAKALGADYALNSSGDVVADIHRLLPEGADNVVDAVGINALINTAMELIKYNGKICCYGISPKLDMTLDWSRAPYNWQLHFVQWPLKNEEYLAHNQIMGWMETGVLRPADFISDVFDFENILDAFKMVEEKRTRKKIVIR